MMKHTIALMLIVVNIGYAQIPATLRLDQPIQFDDDLNFENMVKAIDRQLVYFNRTDLSGTFKLADKTYARADLKRTLVSFKKLVRLSQLCMQTTPKSLCMRDFSTWVNSKFDIYRPLPTVGERGFEQGKTVFTAYYSPDIKGSFTRSSTFNKPIYKRPLDEKLARSSRVEIDFEGALEGKGLEIAYTSESFYDLWLLHVEGGGRLLIENAKGETEKYYLSYHSTNRNRFAMLYHYMFENGMLEPGKEGVYYQRKFLAENPHRIKEVMASSPSYVYFKITEDEPLGVHNIPLTENRSLATDYRLYKEYGLLNFVQLEKPVVEHGELVYKPISRFFISQDTGGAIKGAARSDLYFGFGKKAAVVANNLHTLGNQFFLMIKK